MKQYSLILFSFLFIPVCLGQSPLSSPDIMYSSVVPASVNAKAPNVASLGRFGDLNVNVNTGQPSINIPLYDIRLSNINIPLTLSYNASGIKVDQYPSWVGLGWSLLAGGFISRNVKGIPDDYMFPDHDHYKDTEKGYLFTKSKLDLPGNAWYDPGVLALFTIPFAAENEWNPDYLADGEPDEFNFSFGAYSGSFFMNEKGEWKIKSKDKLALEITHEVNTDPAIYAEEEDLYITMKIMKLITKFKITTPDGIKYTFGGDLNAMDFSRGGVDDLQKFWDNQKYYNISPTAWYLTEVENTVGDKIILNYERGLNLIRYARGVADIKNTSITDGSNTQSNRESIIGNIITPCYLKKISTPFQDIEFLRSYTDEMIFDEIAIPKYYPDGSGVYYWHSLAYFENQMLKATVQIEAEPGNNYRGWLDFMTSPYKNGFNIRPMPSLSNQRTPNYQFKLDAIKVFDKIKASYSLSFNLNYTNSTSLRLFLDSVVSIGSNGAPQRYSFEYQSRELVPNYNVLTKDQWGYNNGVNYTSASMPIKFSPDAWRLPSEDLTKYGTIKKIIYPTGGTSEFIFELNDYSQFQNVSLSDDLGKTGIVSLLNAGGNIKAGGLRIKKIINQAGFGAPQLEREFFYTKNYLSGGTISSGILSGKNKYCIKTIYEDMCSGDIGSTEVWSDNSFFPWGEDRSNLVLYSEITEKNASGYSVHKYTNYDSPGGLDELHLMPFILGLNYSDIYKLTSNDLERGLLLSEEYYNTSKIKVKERLNEYQYLTTRKDSFAKCLYRSDALEMKVNSALFWWIPTCIKMDFYRMYPYKKYYYNVPLQKTTETLYENGGAITTSQSYIYDQYGNVTQQTTYNSAGETLVTDTRYNVHPDYQGTATGASALGIKRLLANYKIKNYPVEQTTLLYPPAAMSEKFTDGTLYVYDANKPVVAKVYKMELDAPFQKYTVSGGTGTLNYLPSTFASGSLSFNNKYQLQESVTAFAAANGNPLTVARKAATEAYTWDNYNQMVSSITTGADNANVAYCNFEGIYGAIDENKGNWDFGADYIVSSLTAPMGSKVLNLVATTAGPQNELRTMDSLVAGKKYILSFWIPDPVVSSRFPKVYTGTTLLPAPVAKKTANGWIYHELLFTAENRKLFIKLPAAASGTISNTLDEVRLYPEGAAMKSYTYDAPTGNVTNACDGNSDILHYEYDGMGRLTTVKDEQGKIINQNTYRYQGAE